MRTIRRIATVTTVITMMLALAVAPAQAAGFAPALSPRSPGFVPPPAGGRYPSVVGDTGFVPPAAVDVELGACGTQLYGEVTTGSNPRQTRTITYKNGDVKTVWRGTERVTITDINTDDTVVGKTVTFPVSGAATEIDYASGATYLDRRASTLIFRTSSSLAPSAEATALEGAGLPSFFWLSGGALTEFTPANGKMRLVTEPLHERAVCAVIGLNSFTALPAHGAVVVF